MKKTKLDLIISTLIALEREYQRKYNTALARGRWATALEAQSALSVLAIARTQVVTIIEQPDDTTTTTAPAQG